MLFDTVYKTWLIVINFGTIVMSKFVIQKCKRFMPRPNSVIPYLVKFSIRILQVNTEQQLELWTQKNTKMFCYIFYKTRPILIKFGTRFPD